MPLISLVYVSFAAHDMTDDELRLLLEECRRGNEPIHVTGMLLYGSGVFIQVLEGEQEAVEKLFEGISSDERHRNVTLIYKAEIARRSFPNWSMGYSLIDRENLDKMAGLNDFLSNPHQDMSYFTDQPSRATHLLEVFREQLSH